MAIRNIAQNRQGAAVEGEQQQAGMVSAPGSSSESQSPASGLTAGAMTALAVEEESQDATDTQNEGTEQGQDQKVKTPLDHTTIAQNAVERFFSGRALNDGIAYLWSTETQQDKGDFYKLPREAREAYIADFFEKAKGVDIKKGSEAPFVLQSVKRGFLAASDGAYQAKASAGRNNVTDDSIVQPSMQGAAFAALAIHYYEGNAFSKKDLAGQGESGKFSTFYDGNKALGGIKERLEKSGMDADKIANALKNVDWFAKALQAANDAGDQKGTAAIAGTLIALEASNWVTRPFAKPQTLGGIREYLKEHKSFKVAKPEDLGGALAAWMDHAKYDASKGDKAKYAAQDTAHAMRSLFFRVAVSAPGAKAPDATTATSEKGPKVATDRNNNPIAETPQEAMDALVGSVFGKTVPALNADLSEALGTAKEGGKYAFYYTNDKSKETFLGHLATLAELGQVKEDTLTDEQADRLTKSYNWFGLNEARVEKAMEVVDKL